MNYEIQFAKITNSGKLTDRFLSSQHAKSPDFQKSSMGEVFSLLEILSPWYNSAQIGQMIIGNFANEYYIGESTSDLVNFEAALKKINENLAAATQNGETEWIGNLNGILAAIVGNSLILSPSGRVEAYLLRDGKVNHLTYGLTSSSEIHPLKTFSNVVSGQLKPHDKILIANKNLFENLSLESLRQIITLNDVSTAALQITKLLRKAKVKNVNVLIVNLLTKEEVSSGAVREGEKVFYLDKSTESFLTGIAVFWQSILSPLTKAAGSSGAKSLKNALSKTGSAVSHGASALKSRLPKKEIKKPIEAPKLTKKPDQFQDEFLSDSHDDLLKDEEINYSPDLYVHYYKEKQNTKKSQNRFKAVTNILHSIGSFLSGVFKWFISLYTQKDKRKYFYIIIAAILILIIVLFISLRGKSNNVGTLEAQKILDEAISAQKEAKNSLSGGNQDKAKEQFLTAITKARSITSNSLVANDANEVITAAYQEFDRLTSTTRVQNLEPLFSIGETAKGVFVVGGEAFLVGESDIYKANLLGGKAQKIASIPKNKGSFSSGTVLDNIIYLYTNNQSVFDLDPRTGKLEQTQLSSDSRFETANSTTGYVGSLYLLDSVVGQIYKHASTSQVFGQGEEYLGTAYTNNLKQSVSIAVDGAIYILKDSGQVLKFQRSKLQDFSLKNIPTPTDTIKEPRKIVTDSDTPSLYILETDQKRVLEFDKEGVFVRQYAMPDSFDKISDFIVSVKSKKMWVTNDKSLYEISI